MTAERRSVVAADRCRNSVFGKEPLKTAAHRRRSRIGHRPHFQQVAAVLIAHRQRIALALGIIPPPLEIYRPNLVGRLRPPPTGDSPARRGRADASLLGQPTAFQHSLETALARTHTPLPQVARGACADPSADAVP